MRLETDADIPTDASLKATVVEEQKPNVSYADKIQFAWRMSEGEGGIVRDVVGGQDGQINGATWSANENYLDGQYLSGDGTDDYVKTGKLNNFGSNMSSNFSIAFTWETSDISYPVGVINNSDGTRLEIRSGASTVPDDKVGLLIGDSSGNLEQAHNSTTSVVDGNRYRIVLNKTGSSASDFEFWINGSNDGTTVLNSNGLGTITNFDSDFAFFARNNGGTIDGYTNIVLDNIIVMEDSLTQKEIKEDYHAQPWVTPSVSNVTAVNY